MHLVDGHTLSVAAGTAHGVYHYAQVGLANRKNGRPSVQWELLSAFAGQMLGRAIEQGARCIYETDDDNHPNSAWTAQAAPLLKLLAGRSDLEREIDSLKAGNSALSRENRDLTKETAELKARLEKLKNLDLELEEKSRR